jgi:hypothetical protein
MQGRIAMRSVLRLAGITGVGLLGLASVAVAEPPPERVWDLGIGAYGWLTAAELEIEGTNRFTGEDFSRNFHKDLGDAFEDMDGGGGAYVDFRYKRFVGLVDGAWVQSDYNGDGYQTSTIVDAKVGFRVLDVERPFSNATGPDAPRFHLDLLAGARFHDSDANVDDVRGKPLAYDQQRDWFNPVVGLRWRVEIIPNLTFGAVADIGGFDLGSASHLTWSLNPRLNYRAWDHFDVFIGWRRLSDDHDGEREVGLNGPQAGIGYSF